MPLKNLILVRRPFFFAETWIETMSYKLHMIPKSQIDHSTLFEPAPQVIDGKIYFLENYSTKQEGSPQIRQVLAFDLSTMKLMLLWTQNIDSQSWAEVKTEASPNLTKIGRTIFYNNHLLFYPIVENDIPIFGEFWSLLLSIFFQIFHSQKARSSKTLQIFFNFTDCQQSSTDHERVLFRSSLFRYFLRSWISNHPGT